MILIFNMRTMYDGQVIVACNRYKKSKLIGRNIFSLHLLVIILCSIIIMKIAL